ncbi:tetratricopeptide repeat protein, partial [archaeon]|nr:tetratricopeptide repeat protein [archaeon]
MISRRIILPIVVTLFLLSHGASRAQNIDRAREAMDLYQYADAVAVLKQIIEKGGKDSDPATVLLADCYKAMNENLPAEEWYARAASLPITDTSVFFNYGLVLRANGKYPQAEAQFRKYNTLKPADPRG